MIQKTYRLDEDESLSDLLHDLAEDEDYIRAADRLMLIFEPETDRTRIQRELHQIAETLPDLKVAGMTLIGPISEKMKLPVSTTYSLFLFDHSSVRVDLIDGTEKTPAEAGADFADILSGIVDKKGVLVMSSRAEYCPSGFLEAVSERYPDLPFFGSQAGSKNFREDKSVVFCSSGIYSQAFLSVTFCGADLHLDVHCNLGWKALGIQHVITRTSGECCADTIDHYPAINLYPRYLDIRMDEQFYANACAFPLLRQNGRVDSALVPLRVTDNGGIIFAMKVEEGEKVSLSYTKPINLISESFRWANETAKMEPQAMILFSCVNRRLFLGNKNEDRELSYFYDVCPSLCCGYGYSELLRIGTDGGVLNSTMIIVWFREGESSGYQPAPFLDPEMDRERQKITLSDRLVTFLEQTTFELRKTVRELKVQAVIDQLTGVANRRALDSSIETLIEENNRGIRFSALMFDIDFFKQVNDTFGHQAGDHVLREMADVVKDEIRETDLFGRWGGEEFVCLFADTSVDEAYRIAERIRRAVAEHKFQAIGRITLSIGVSGSRDGDTVDRVVARIDEALYRAKELGRNCVVRYEDICRERVERSNT